MKKIIETFKSTLKNNPDCPVTFTLDSDNPQSMRFIEYLNNNRSLVQHNGKIVFLPYGKNIERFIFGIAPIWKEYENRESFESYYTNSEMMRELFCNERDVNGQLIPIYAEINGVKYIVTWETKNDTEIFHYKMATFEERGLADVLWSIFGGIKSKEDRNEIKQLNPQIGITFEVDINKNYGYNLGFAQRLNNHAYSLGYAVGGNIKMSIG